MGVAQSGGKRRSRPDGIELDSGSDERSGSSCRLPNHGVTVAISDVSVTLGDDKKSILSGFSLNIEPREFVSIVGASGCGKTTLLNVVSGEILPDTGSVRLWSEESKEGEPNVGYMFARDGLFPWRTAQRNVELGLEFRGVNKLERKVAALELLSRVGLAEAAEKLPAELSQGMRQRVALARTLASNPKLLLLDEPFASLDTQTRVDLQESFCPIWEELSITVMLVTHDVWEAVLLSDRVVVMSGPPARIVAEISVAAGRPRDIRKLRKDAGIVALVARVQDAVQGNRG